MAKCTQRKSGMLKAIRKKDPEITPDGFMANEKDKRIITELIQ